MRNSGQNRSYQEILSLCDERICALVEQFNIFLREENKAEGTAEEPVHSPVLAEVFGSFSNAEIAILWSAKQYTDIMYLVDSIRDFQYRLRDESGEQRESFFRTTYTMVSFPDATRQSEGGDWDGMKDTSLASIRGKAEILLATQDNAGESSYYEIEAFLNKCLDNAGNMLGKDSVPALKLRRSAGEYDLAGTVDSCYISRLFSNPLNWHLSGWQFDNNQLRDEDYAFLMKIIIPRRLKADLGTMLYEFGSSKERIYPELQNHRNR